MNDDALLIAKTLAGSGAAFGELVLKYQDRLFNAVYYVVRSRTEAEDVVQDAFVRAYTKLRSFNQESSLYTWLYRIAMNGAISRRRQRRPEQSVEQTRELLGDEPLDPGDLPEEQLERRERAAQVHEALGQLAAEHRAILVLREMEGCSYEQIAEVLDVPVGTVRSRLHRARLQLRDQLKADFQEASGNPPSD